VDEEIFVTRLLLKCVGFDMVDGHRLLNQRSIKKIIE